MKKEALVQIRRALVSVWDKTGLEELSNLFREYEIEVISTGKTAQVLKKLGVKVIDVSEWTGSPEILSGRVKTLHPKVHAGILYRRDNSVDQEELEKIASSPIDLIVVNLYPFPAAYRSGEKDLVEFIDIGGPTLLRAGAKNFLWVTVVSSPEDYPSLVEEIRRNNGRTTLKFRKQMARKVFSLTARYDLWISQVLFGDTPGLMEDEIGLGFYRALRLRYGENPHQKGNFYLPFGEEIRFEQIQGKELSYNNLVDLSSAWEMVSWFSPRICAVVVKHGNPCGLALGEDPSQAYRRSYQADPLSSFGGIIGINTKVDEKCAKEILRSGFRECVIAPEFSREAISIFSNKPNLRVVKIKKYKPSLPIRAVFNGYLIQEKDKLRLKESDLKLVTKKRPTKSQIEDLIFAFEVVRFVKSNAIVVAKGGRVLGVGAGQMSRVEAVEIALKKAGEKAKGAVLASDAFFPKTDNIELCARAGIKAIIQPGGSKADQEVIRTADNYKIAMVFTGHRHFLH